MPSCIVGIWVLLGTWGWGVPRTEVEWACGRTCNVWFNNLSCGPFFSFFSFFLFLFFFNDEEEPSQDKATSCISFY